MLEEKYKLEYLRNTMLVLFYTLTISISVSILIFIKAKSKRDRVSSTLSWISIVHILQGQLWLVGTCIKLNIYQGTLTKNEWMDDVNVRE